MIQTRWKQQLHVAGGVKFSYLTSTEDATWLAYEIETPEGLVVNVTPRVIADGPGLLGATVVSITTSDSVPAHPDGEPRLQVALNDATLYDREEIPPLSRDDYWLKLCAWYRVDPDAPGIAGLRSKPATHCHRYVGVAHDMPPAACDPTAHLDTFDTFEQACEHLGSAVIDGYLPEAIYDLDTGQRIDLHISSPVVTKSADQIGLNPLQEA